MQNIPSRMTALALSALTVVFLSGCEGAYRSAPVKPDVARDTLRLTLERWQAGDSLESLRQHTPEIVVQDLDWSGGAKLLSFELLGDGEPVDANLVARVKLTLQTADGKQVDKSVTYVVGTSPVLTVFRDLTR